jgi:hypothetical protein
MLNSKKLSIGNAASKVTLTAPNGVTTAFIPAVNKTTGSANGAVLRIATADPHNFFVGSLVTITGLKNQWDGLTVGASWTSSIVAVPIIRIDDPYSFCIDQPYAPYSTLGYLSYVEFAPFTGATSADLGYIWSNATAYAVNGQLGSVNVKYAQQP